MGSKWESKKRWKHPSDRELTLRAKLNFGWSIHTTNVFLKPKVLDVRELQAIEEVIQRANDLERLEVERVGRMICKLENMSNNALGDGEKSCSMCGTNFGIFKSSCIFCVDCNKAVCKKCRVDTLTASLDVCMLCKICSENREVWKKSGGWFYGKLPTMTVECQQMCASQTSGSPSLARSFDTWSHRAPDIVRLQSYEPPEENHNELTQYTSWTINSADKEDASSLVDSDLIDGNENDHSTKSSMENSIPSIYSIESLEQLEKNNIIQNENLKVNSIPDLHFRRDTSRIGLEPFRKRSLDKNQMDLNYLSVQNTKLFSSCPSLTDLKEPCKLIRKPSIRRKRTSAPVREKLVHE